MNGARRLDVNRLRLRAAAQGLDRVVAAGEREGEPPVVVGRRLGDEGAGFNGLHGDAGHRSGTALERRSLRERRKPRPPANVPAALREVFWEPGVVKARVGLCVEVEDATPAR